MPSGWLGSLDWGNVPVWISSMLTSGSVTVATLVYRRSKLDKEAEQAAKIYAWVDDSNADTSGKGRILRIRNNSDSVVYAVYAKPVGGDPVGVGELPEKSEYRLRLTPVDSERLKKVASIRFPATVVSAKYSVELRRVEPLPLLRFRDAFGRWWGKDERGNIRRIKRGYTVVNDRLSLDIFRFNIIEITSDYDKWKPSITVSVFGFNLFETIFDYDKGRPSITFSRRRGRTPKRQSQLQGSSGSPPEAAVDAE